MIFLEALDVPETDEWLELLEEEEITEEPEVDDVECVEELLWRLREEEFEKDELEELDDEDPVELELDVLESLLFPSPPSVFGCFSL